MAMRPLNINPVDYAVMAGFAAGNAKTATSDPALKKLAESLEQLSHAVSVIAKRQEEIMKRANGR